MYAYCGIATRAGLSLTKYENKPSSRLRTRLLDKLIILTYLITLHKYTEPVIPTPLLIARKEPSQCLDNKESIQLCRTENITRSSSSSYKSRKQMFFVLNRFGWGSQDLVGRGD